MSIRTRFIQFYIHVNELLFFYPKLRKYYRLALKKNRLNVIDVGANKGQTIDFFLGITPNVTVWAFEPNKKLANNLNYDQCLLEYKTTGTGMPWIHISINVSGQRSQVLTLLNDKKYSAGLTKLA